MYSRRIALLVALAALTAASGCCQQEVQRTADLSGHGAFLFGPSALPLGEEDLGYFAVAPQAEPPLAMFDHQSVYIRSRIYEVEDNRRSGLSYHRRVTQTERQYLYQR